MAVRFLVGAPTCDQIYHDIVFFLSQSKRAIPSQRKRYARATIIFTAFFFESMASLLMDKASYKYGPLEPRRNENHLPKPLQKFRLVFQKVKGTPMALESTGIQDLFIVRNKVFGHPAAWFYSEGSEVPKGKGLTQDRKPLPFRKFKDFPNVYTEFDSGHAEALLREVKDFLQGYYDLTKEEFAVELRQFQRSYLDLLEHIEKFK